MREINSKTSETIIKYRKLKDKKYRDEYGLYLIEGARMVKDALAYPQSLDAVFVQKSKLEKFEAILRAANNEKVFVLDDKVFEGFSNTVNSQGIMAALFIKKPALARPFGNCLVLDGIADPGNLGAIIRTAAAFNYLDIYLYNCADPYNPKVVRSTMSGIFNVRLYEDEIENIVKTIKDCNYKLYCADMQGNDINQFKNEGNFALCIGSEAFGISEYLQSKSDAVISIPMQSTAESLNAAVSAGILMFELKK